MSGLLSADKLHTLRTVTGASLPDSKLRAALARAAGDLNLAASRLLSDAAAAGPLRVAAPSQSAQPSARSNGRDRKPVSNTGSALSKPPLASLPANSDVAHARRLAWREFYCNHHAEAVQETGGEKRLVDEFIVNLWKKLGSKRRQRFTQDVLRRVEEEDARAKAEPESESRQGEQPVSPHPPAKSFDQPRALSSPVKLAIKSPPEASAVDANPPPPQPTPQTHPQSPPPAQPSTAHASVPHSPPAKRPRAVEWPRELVTRSSYGIMLTRGRNLLRAGDRLQLSAPPVRPKKAREKKMPTRLVRFSKNGRELGRLAPDLAHALAPSLQSGFVEAHGKVIWAPRVIGMFAEVLVEVSLFISKDAFEANGASVEAGLGDDGEGIDAKRVNVVSTILDLKLCEQPGERTQSDNNGNLAEGLNAEDPGAVDESAVEAYYNTVDKINAQEASKYQPPSSLACTLREYQKVGVLWMTAQEKHGRRGRDLAPTLINPLWKKCSFADGGVFYMNTTTGCLSLDSPVESTGGPYGGILADEMGLGKTVQCIACILHDIEEEQGASGKTELKENTQQSMELAGNCADKSEGGSTPGQNDSAKTLKCEANEDMDVDEVKDDHESQITEPEPGEQGTEVLSRDEGTAQKVPGSNMDRVMHDGAPSNPRLNSLRSRVRKPKRTIEEFAEHEISCDADESDKDYEEVTNCEISDDDWIEVKRKKPGSKRKRRKKGGQLQSAASLLMASAAKKKASFGGTLIVCPTSLVTQWINELNQHVIPNFLRVTTHYGQGRGDSRSISLVGADVVVTSYGTLAAECSEDTANGEDICSRDGPLFQLQWRRIILDEAHTIKSRITKWAKASYKIRAERRCHGRHGHFGIVLLYRTLNRTM
ncbi:Helicase 1/2 ATP-binding [Gracilaria domingensis]|nr:Helicase 1/2 ATP-binding [Gracilaria domingensis]